MELSVSPLPKYSSLTDTHLSGYFSSRSKRRHLKKAGLISGSGLVIPETKVRCNMLKQERKRQMKTTLAQEIVEKTLEIERQRQIAIQRKLEEITKLELVKRIRTAETDQKKRNGDFLSVVSLKPVKLRSSRFRRPSLGAKEKLHMETVVRRRPFSAPISRSTSSTTVSDGSDVVQYINVNVRSTNSVLDADDEDRSLDLTQSYKVKPLTLSKYAMAMKKLEKSRSEGSPYTTASTIPMPPKSPHFTDTNKTRRRNQDRPYSASKNFYQSSESIISHPNATQNMTQMVMKYHGWKLSLAREKLDPKNMVVVEQQHCGGNTLVIFKGRLLPKTEFTIFSHRHRGYPFSLTIYVDGRMDCRVSTCCEYRHALNVRLGGAQGHFSFIDVRGNMPCYKCRVEMEGRKKKKPQQVETDVLSSYTTDTVNTVEIIEEIRDKEVKVPVEPIIVGHELELEGDYSDNDFEESEPKSERKSDKKIEVCQVQKNLLPVNSGNKETRRNEWTTEVEASLAERDAAMTYTFLRKYNNDMDTPLSDVRGPREITITDDKKWIITVQGPPSAEPRRKDRKDRTLVKQTTHEVTLHKDNRSLICIKGDSSDFDDDVVVVGCKPDVSEDFMDSEDSQSTLRSSSSIHHDSHSTPIFHRRLESGSSTQNISNEGNEKKVKRTLKKSQKQKRSKKNNKMNSIEDETESAELLREVDSYINTADEVSDIENEVASPVGLITEQHVLTQSPSSSSKSAVSARLSRKDLAKRPTNHKEDVYRSRENLYVPDQDDTTTMNEWDMNSDIIQTPETSDTSRAVPDNKDSHDDKGDDGLTQSDYSHPASYPDNRDNVYETLNRKSDDSSENKKKHSTDYKVQTDSTGDHSNLDTRDSEYDNVKGPDFDKLIIEGDNIDSNLKSSLRKSHRITTSKSVSFQSEDLTYKLSEYEQNNHVEASDMFGQETEDSSIDSSQSSGIKSTSEDSDFDGENRQIYTHPNQNP